MANKLLFTVKIWFWIWIIGEGSFFASDVVVVVAGY